MTSDESVCFKCRGVMPWSVDSEVNVYKSKTDAPDVVVCEACEFIYGYGVALAMDRAGLIGWEPGPLVLP